MGLIEWKDDYSVGVKLLDDQHKGLVQQLNSLHTAMELGKAKASLHEILDTLVQYAFIHFKTEEELFEKYDYVNVTSHVSEHEYFAKEVLSFKDHHDTGRFLVSFEVLAFLKNWILEHILICDMKYKDFLLSKGEK